MIDLIQTDRLVLRRFDLADAARVEALAGDEAIARMTGNIPHPYPRGAAKGWIEHTQPMIRAGVLAQAAVTRKGSDDLIGCASLKRETTSDDQAELAYWIGVPFWGSGLATEACRALVADVAGRWKLRRVWAGVLPINQRSARVLQKLGMTPDGEYEVERRQERVRLLRFAKSVGEEDAD